MFSLICALINGWVNIREADDLIRHRAHYDVSVMALDEDGYLTGNDDYTEDDCGIDNHSNTTADGYNDHANTKLQITKTIII